MERMSLEPKFKEMEFNLTNYKAFVKGALENKERLEEEEAIPVSEECSAIIQQDTNLSKMLKDPERCTFLYNAGNEHFERFICVLGSGISLMPTCIALLCGIYKELKLMPISIQLADKSVVKPMGVIEDVLVWVDKFIILINFFVMDMKKNRWCTLNVSQILHL